MCARCWAPRRWCRRRKTRPQLLDWALGRPTGTTDWRLGNRDDHGVYEAIFHIPGQPNGMGRIVEAVVTKARNGLAINFPDPAMRRRDPDAMVIGDTLPTDKPTYEQRFGEPFDKTRQQTLDWLKTQELVAMPFYAGADASEIRLAADCSATGGILCGGVGGFAGHDSAQPGASGFQNHGRSAVCCAAVPAHAFWRAAGGGARSRGDAPGDFCLQPLSRTEREKGRLLDAARHWRARGLDDESLRRGGRSDAVRESADPDARRRDRAAARAR